MPRWNTLTIVRVDFNNRVTLHLDGTDGAWGRVALEAPVESATLGVNVLPAEPGSRRDALARMWGDVVDIEVTDDGELRVESPTMGLLRIPPCDDVEAWAVLRHDGSRLVCAPGGSVSAWEAAAARLATEETWFTVRCVIAHPAETGRRGGDGDGDTLYEERLTTWQAPTFDEAIARARTDAEAYSAEVGAACLEFAQAYAMDDAPAGGGEAFSLMRESALSADDYLARFFATGAEREAVQEPPVGRGDARPTRRRGCRWRGSRRWDG